MESEHSPGTVCRLWIKRLSLNFVMKQNRCLQEKRCVSMPSVSLTSSSNNSLHRSRFLRLQDRRFRQRFPEVPQDEKLLNYFSCALVSDILLQGHLFITKNFFAFYSNIFGHKTQILISVADVVKVTKEKIAKIIPNAVGVYTDSDKFIFGSMLSRDSAFRVIQQTWIQSTDAGVGLPDDSDSEVSPAIMLLADEESSVSSSVSGHMISDDAPVSTSDITTQDVVTSSSPQLVEPHSFPQKKIIPPLTQHITPSSCSFSLAKGYIVKVDEIIKELSQLSRTSLLFLMSTILLFLLFISTTVLLYRIHLLHQKLLAKDDFYTGSIPNFGEVSDVLKPDFSSVVENLEERIHSLSEVRSTLEKIIALADKLQVPRPSIPQHVT
ncbi:GRAM domain-containing protein 2B-like isoform X2 [Stegodyphus dumicola]|uniref:GRAM domain-containing protein 2B-like isoform X2 n=1 Tax=Stegodyphus dumicola TaxID=202533 RepID=UPI0015ADA1A3|nr:GRAM domain-containing protein 2B-like isoform X2 [Stegodyphus dumicola]